MAHIGIDMVRYAHFEKASHILAAEYDRTVRAVRQRNFSVNNRFQALGAMCLALNNGDRKSKSAHAFLPSKLLMDESLLMCSDKNPTAHHESNFVVLSPAAREVIQNQFHYHARSVIAYKKENNLNLAGRALTLSNAEISEDEQPEAFFYVLNSTRDQSSPMGTCEIEKELSELWPYPISECRRQISRALKLRGVPDYLVELQLGHLRMSCPPFSEQWTQSVIEVRDLLLPHLKQYMEDLGWKV